MFEFCCISQMSMPAPIAWTSPDGMKYTSPRVNLHIPQCPAYPVLSDGALKLLPRAVLLQTENELRALVRLDYVPHLSLPELALVLQRVVVGRVNLYRQLIPRVDELYEQRETVGVIVLSDKPVSAPFRAIRLRGACPCIRRYL